jgi:multidrug efflux pump subunit AcrA (membrane-fusion protein)
MEIKTGLIRAILMLAVGSWTACHPAEKPAASDDAAPDPRTPVKVASVEKGTMTEYVDVNATSTFLQKSYVKASSNGYLQSVDAYLGKFVRKGDLIFRLKTKEAQSLGNAINALDSTFKFSGVIDIKATDQGYLTQLNHQTGDYVQEGEQLAAISNMNSFVFILELPYELRPYLEKQKTVELTLPDGLKLRGAIQSSLPTVDAGSQTQSIVLRVNPPHPIPENLIAKVRIIKYNKPSTVSLPKSAILTNETQDEFWIMKMIDSGTAVRLPVKKGIETSDRVEILSPPLSEQDKVLVSGNYGLPDTAKVKIETP